MNQKRKPTLLVGADPCAIARALVSHPQLVLADELMLNLDLAPLLKSSNIENYELRITNYEKAITSNCE